MAYEKQTWSCGETITADKLNHMEDGIMESGGGSALIVEAAYDSDNDCHTLDKTWQEIFDAFTSSGCVIHESVMTPGGYIYTYAAIESVTNVPGVGLIVKSINYEYTSATEDGYPSSGIG